MSTYKDFKLKNNNFLETRKTKEHHCFIYFLNLLNVCLKKKSEILTSASTTLCCIITQLIASGKPHFTLKREFSGK